MRIIKQYQCEHCKKVYENKEYCEIHEKNCICNKNIWELKRFRCNPTTGKFDDTNIDICSYEVCCFDEHCTGFKVFRVNKITGEILGV